MECAKPDLPAVPVSQNSCLLPECDAVCCLVFRQVLVPVVSRKCWKAALECGLSDVLHATERNLLHLPERNLTEDSTTCCSLSL